MRLGGIWESEQTWMLMAICRPGCGRATPLATEMTVVKNAIVERNFMVACN